MKKVVTLILAIAAVCLLPDPPLPAVSGEAQERFLRARRPVPDQYVVVFGESVLPREVGQMSRALTRAHGGRIIALFEYAPKGFAVEMPEATARALSRHPSVKYVEENAVVTSAFGIEPGGGDDPIYIGDPIQPAANCFGAQDTYSWSIDRIDQRAIPRDGLYCPNRTGRGVNVYVIDTGIWPSHEDFKLHPEDATGRARVAYDAFRSTSDPNYGKDCLGHGTQVASIIGGKAKGVAREVNLYGVQVFSCGGSSNTIAVNSGINWVANNHIKPAVANMSLTIRQISTSTDDAVRDAIRRGVTFTVGAAADNVDASSYSPGRVAEAITVGASDILDKNAGAQTTEVRGSFGGGSASNYGPVLDLFAPGAGGQGATTGISNGSNSGYGDIGGTSMASGMAAGVAAMYLEANPFAAPAQVAQAMRNNATPNALSGDIGPGSPNLMLYANFVNAARDTFQFTAANYTANEGDGRLTVTVTRTGGNSNQPASVEYATSDNTSGIRCDSANGSASDRCDYTTTLGVLRFAAGETSKTITVFLTDDAFVEGTETGRIALSMPTGGDLGSLSSATLTVTDNDGAPSANPIEDNRFFVRMHYIDFLNREPEQSGWDAWTAVLAGCPTQFDSPDCDRIHVSSSFFRSPEFQLKGYFVYRFYTASLARRPNYLEFTRDSQRVTGATSEEVFARRAAFAEEWVQRPEFQSRYGGLSNAAYVDALLQTAGVGNVITTDGVTYTRDGLIGSLDAGARTRAQTLTLIVESDQEKGQEFNGAFVAMEYFGYLRREADESGYQAWLGVLNANPNDYRTMVNGFIRSSEYRLRFGQP